MQDLVELQESDTRTWILKAVDSAVLLQKDGSKLPISDDDYDVFFADNVDGLIRDEIYDDQIKPFMHSLTEFSKKMSGISKTITRDLRSAFNFDVPSLTSVTKIASKVKPEPLDLNLVPHDPPFRTHSGDGVNFSAQQTLDRLTEISNNIVAHTRETRKGNRSSSFIWWITFPLTLVTFLIVLLGFLRHEAEHWLSWIISLSH